MNLELDGDHVLVTGGSRGIGLACAETFLREGARVTLMARDPANLETARRQLTEAVAGSGDRIHLVAIDLTDADATARAIDRMESAGRAITVLVNSAGAARRTPPADLTPRHWHDAMTAKYFTYMHAIDPVVKRMAARGRGAIVNVIGMGGKVASPIHLAGGAANAALMLVTAGLAAAYGAKGVRVNAVNPASTLTDRLQEGLEADARQQGITVEDAKARISARIPLGRMAEPAEIADAVVYLASRRASYISGAIISMDGAVTPLVA